MCGRHNDRSIGAGIILPKLENNEWFIEIENERTYCYFGPVEIQSMDGGLFISEPVIIVSRGEYNAWVDIPA